jgi:hypothetical protein
MFKIFGWRVFGGFGGFGDRGCRCSCVCYLFGVFVVHELFSFL